jgi:hypothetical protein
MSSHPLAPPLGPLCRGLALLALALPALAQQPSQAPQSPQPPQAAQAPQTAQGPQAPQSPGKAYAPGPFQRLVISGAAEVRLQQGERDTVFIRGDEALQNSVELRLTGNELLVQPSGGWKFWRSSRLQMEVTMRQLDRLAITGNGEVHAPATFRADRLDVSISGSGLVRFDDLQAQRLSFAIVGSGEGQMRGQSNALSLAISGKGKLEAAQLRSERAAVAISGVGDVQLWATRVLSVNIIGAGTVDYWGSPQISRAISGVGKLNALGESPPGP